ncbi:MAG: hypothetical protein WDN28_13925 [Chthoniobacter sp.]
MPTPADHHRRVAEFHQRPEFFMRQPHERAGAIRHVESRLAPLGARLVRCAMGGDHHLRRLRGCRVVERPFAHALPHQAFADDRVVDEFAEDGERGAPGQFFRLGDGVADAETKAVVFCELDFHKGIGEGYFVRQSLRAKKTHGRPL